MLYSLNYITWSWSSVDTGIGTLPCVLIDIHHHELHTVKLNWTFPKNRFAVVLFSGSFKAFQGFLSTFRGFFFKFSTNSLACDRVSGNRTVFLPEYFDFPTVSIVPPLLYTYYFIRLTPIVYKFGTIKQNIIVFSPSLVYGWQEIY